MRQERVEVENPQITKGLIVERPLLAKLWSLGEITLGTVFWAGLAIVAFQTIGISMNTNLNTAALSEMLDPALNVLKVSAVSGATWGIARSIRWVSTLK